MVERSCENVDYDFFRESFLQKVRAKLVLRGAEWGGDAVSCVRCAGSSHESCEEGSLYEKTGGFSGIECNATFAPVPSTASHVLKTDYFSLLNVVAAGR